MAAHQAPPPWDSPGKNTGLGCHFLLQCMKVKSESEVAQSCPTLSDSMDCSPPGSSVHGIFQARVLEWGAIAFSEVWLRNLYFKQEAFLNIFSIYLEQTNPQINSQYIYLRQCINIICPQFIKINLKKYAYLRVIINYLHCHLKKSTHFYINRSQNSRRNPFERGLSEKESVCC